MPVTHAFTSGVADDPNHPEEVRPSNWNAGHTVSINLATEVTGILDASHLDATLTALAGLTITAQSLIVGTGADAFSVLANPGLGNYYLGWAGSSVAWTSFPVVAVPNWNAVLNSGNTSSGKNAQLTTTDQLQLRDTAKYIRSDTSTSWEGVSDGAIRLTPATGFPLQLRNANIYNETRTIPTTVSDEVDIGSFALTNGVGNFEIWVNVPSGGYTQSKRYFIPAFYAGTAGAWQKVCAASNTGPYNNSGVLQDVDLEINSNLATTSFRLRRVSGTTAGTAQIMIIHEGTVADVFTPSTATSSVAAITATYRAFADQLQILSIPGDLGSYSFSSWNGTGVPVTSFLKSPSVSGTAGGAGISPTEPALILGRSGITSTTYPNFVEFKIGRYVNVGAEARTQLDIALTYQNGDAAGTNILSLRSSGMVGANISTPISGFTSFQAAGVTVAAAPFCMVGNSADGTSDSTGGGVLYMTHNSAGNRQIVFNSTDGLAAPTTTAGFRFVFIGGIASIDGIRSDGNVREPMNLGNDTSDVCVGNGGQAYNATLRAKLDVFTEANKVGLVVGALGGVAQVSDFVNIVNSSGTVLTKINATGVTTAPNFISSVATGTAPYACTSTTVNTNLNAQLFNGLSNVSSALTSGNIFYYNGTGFNNLPNPAKFSSYLTNNGSGTLAWSLIPSPAVTPSWSAVLTAGRTSSGVNPQLTTTDKFEIRDTSNYIGSTGTNIIDIVGSGIINLTALAATKAGASTGTIAKIGGSIFDHFVDATVGGAEADIYTDTLPANIFNVNGDKVIAEYGGNFVTVGTELTQLKVYLAGTAIWDSTGVAPTTGTTSWRVYAELIRVSSTVVRYSVSLNTTGASGFVYCTVGELTGLTLSGTNILKITGQSSGVGSGSGDIVGKMSYGQWKSAA